MFRSQLKFQKILSYIVILAFVLLFIYAVSMMTTVYETLYSAYDPELAEYGYGEKVSGAKLFYDMQDFNNAVLVCAIVVIICSLAYFVTGSATRRKYYIGNYVAAGIIAVAYIAVAVYTMIGISGYRTAYLQVDFEALKTYNEKLGITYYKSTFWFDIGYVVCVILIAVAILCVLNVIWKMNLMKKEDALLNGTDDAVLNNDVKEAV